MFTLQSNGGKSPPRELRHEPSTSPLDGVLIDLYAAVLVMVPLALLLRALLF